MMAKMVAVKMLDWSHTLTRTTGEMRLMVRFRLVALTLGNIGTCAIILAERLASASGIFMMAKMAAVKRWIGPHGVTRTTGEMRI